MERSDPPSGRANKKNYLSARPFRLFLVALLLGRLRFGLLFALLRRRFLAGRLIARLLIEINLARIDRDTSATRRCQNSNLSHLLSLRHRPHLARTSRTLRYQPQQSHTRPQPGPPPGCSRTEK